MAIPDDKPGGEKAGESGKVVAVFDNPQAAQVALDALRRADFRVRQIRIPPADFDLKQIVPPGAAPQVAPGPPAKGIGEDQYGELLRMLGENEAGGSIITVEAGDRAHDAMRLMAALPGRPTKVLKY